MRGRPPNNRGPPTSTWRTRETTSSKTASCFAKNQVVRTHQWVEFGSEAAAFLAFHEILNFTSLPKQVEYLELFTICATRGRTWRTKRLAKCVRLLRLAPGK